MITLIPVLIVALFVILVILTAQWNLASSGAGGRQIEELRALRRRVKVLERIVVDQDRQLRRDIDGLG